MKLYTVSDAKQLKIRTHSRMMLRESRPMTILYLAVSEGIQRERLKPIVVVMHTD